MPMVSPKQNAFGQFSSSVSQRPTKLGPVAIVLDSQEDTYGKEHTIEFKRGDIIIKQTGMYLIIAAPQVSKSAGNRYRWLDFWLRVNDSDVANSNIRSTLKDPFSTYVITTQTVTHLKKGDVINVMMSVEVADEGLGIEAIKPTNEPRVPSIILTCLQLQ